MIMAIVCATSMFAANGEGTQLASFAGTGAVVPGECRSATEIPSVGGCETIRSCSQNGTWTIKCKGSQVSECKPDSYSGKKTGNCGTLRCICEIK